MAIIEFTEFEDGEMLLLVHKDDDERILGHVYMTRDTALKLAKEINFIFGYEKVGNI